MGDTVGSLWKLALYHSGIVAFIEALFVSLSGTIGI